MSSAIIIFLLFHTLLISCIRMPNSHINPSIPQFLQMFNFSLFRCYRYYSSNFWSCLSYFLNHLIRQNSYIFRTMNPLFFHTYIRPFNMKPQNSNFLLILHSLHKFNSLFYFLIWRSYKRRQKRSTPISFISFIHYFQRFPRNIIIKQHSSASINLQINKPWRQNHPFNINNFLIFQFFFINQRKIHYLFYKFPFQNNRIFPNKFLPIKYLCIFYNHLNNSSFLYFRIF